MCSVHCSIPSFRLARCKITKKLLRYLGLFCDFLLHRPQTLQIMSKTDDHGASQSWERARQPALSNTNWEQAQLPHHARLSTDSEDVSPHSKGAIPIHDRQNEEMRRKPEDTRARVSPSLAMPRVDKSAPCAPPPKASLAPQNSVPPELLSTLREMIREELDTLKGDMTERKEGAPVNDKPPRPSIVRERPSSPVQPFINAAGVFVHSYPAKDADDKKGPASTPSPTKASPTKGEHKDSPRTSTVRFSDETKPAEPTTSRPEEPRNTSAGKDIELTAIDMRWGVLFDKDGSHTKRMEHVVRGLANYIVEEFMPQKSIVITPEKMAAFYSHHRLEKEPFPLAVLFRARSKDFNGALESLYEDLGCQYFLVQADDRSRHTVPALTPQGFMQWLVTMIQAYPEEEARRLDKVVSALPIEADSLLDGRPERLPKQISRYLLPKEPVRKTKRLVDDAVNDFREDIEGTASQSSKAGSKPTPIIVTATSDKRPSSNAAASGSARYVPDKAAEQPSSGLDRDRRPPASTKDARDEDKHGRNAMPPPPVPTKTARASFAADSGRSSQSSRDSHKEVAGRVPTSSSSSSASTRKSRSPQRNPYSQSAPSGMDREDLNGERFRSSVNISAAAANVAAHILGGGSGAGSTHSLGKEAEKTMREAKDADYFGPFRSKRASLEEQTPRAPASVSSGLRDKVEAESSRTSKRRSVVVADEKRPTWDDYLKHSAPKGVTPAGGFVKKSSTS